MRGLCLRQLEPRQAAQVEGAVGVFLRCRSCEQFIVELVALDDVVALGVYGVAGRSNDRRMAQTETEQPRKPSIAPPAPPKRQPEPEPDESEELEEGDVVTQLRGKLEEARDAIDEALELLEEE